LSQWPFLILKLQRLTPVTEVAGQIPAIPVIGEALVWAGPAWTVGDGRLRPRRRRRDDLVLAMRRGTRGQGGKADGEGYEENETMHGISPASP
jgi:hypothetical protein